MSPRRPARQCTTDPRHPRKSAELREVLGCWLLFASPVVATAGHEPPVAIGMLLAGSALLELKLRWPGGPGGALPA